MENWTYYIDESGNTGTNWLDEKQPFFIYGGWLLNDAQYDMCTKYIKSLFIGKQTKELKAVNFFKYDKDFRKYANIFLKLINEYHAIPIFAIVEKRFMIAAKIVETFYDPAYNPNVNNFFTFPGQWKVDLAEKILKYSDVIEAFADIISYKNNTTIQMKNVSNLLIDNLERDGQKNYALLLKDLKYCNFDEMVNEFDEMTQNGARKKWISLTPTSLIELLKNVELYARVKNYEISVVHDELSNYGEMFQWISDIHLKQYKGEPEIFDNRVMLVGYPHIKDIKQRKSNNDIMIQMADLLCGFIHSTIGYQYNETYNCSKYTSSIWEYLVFLHDKWTKENVCIWNYYASSIITKRLRFILGG